ncbi:cytochrome b/b6 domain-containing protein [Synechococcus sp. CBW1002]|jgi:hypothetical protein|uniref:cytochrome b/b6 domain-containing protein n=1 Tax=Synechococcus sp. CBW1002 TaxID=1353134 RepID=UPI0018CE7B95|nr:cytochrome b/b6 domain-containing protein [Synechococcus sp. CBW1002]QPN60032.1 cytochrome b/b6 domain-containing protein [Synechococcus sp. CBW1002]
MARPYQPSLLRLLHGPTAALVSLAWLSGLLLYSNDDGRWGRLPLRLGGDWIDIHGSIGVLLWPLAILFALYAVSMGRRQLQKPANAITLLALALAVGSGKLMDEDWLKDGQLDHVVYSVHLLAWLVMAGAVLVHILAVLQRGGVPLVRSMASLRIRANDMPRDWPGQIRRALTWRG